MKRQAALDVISILFIILFVYAAASKLMDYEKFEVQLGQSPLITAYSGFVAWSIPTIEILISLMLAIPKLRLIGLYASFSLMVMFTVYIIAITQFSDYVPCSCGGVLQKLGWTEHLIFNLIFVVLALSGIILQKKDDMTNFKEPIHT